MTYITAIAAALKRAGFKVDLFRYEQTMRKALGTNAGDPGKASGDFLTALLRDPELLVPMFGEQVIESRARAVLTEYAKKVQAEARAASAQRDDARSGQGVVADKASITTPGAHQQNDEAGGHEDHAREGHRPLAPASSPLDRDGGHKAGASNGQCKAAPSRSLNEDAGGQLTGARKGQGLPAPASSPVDGAGATTPAPARANSPPPRAVIPISRTEKKELVRAADAAVMQDIRRTWKIDGVPFGKLPLDRIPSIVESGWKRLGEDGIKTATLHTLYERHRWKAASRRGLLLEDVTTAEEAEQALRDVASEVAKGPAKAIVQAMRELSERPYALAAS